MGGFNTLISGLLSGVADPLTASLQTTVQHYRHAERSVDDYNKPTPGAPVLRKAILTKSDKIVRRTSGLEAGELVQASWSIVFPRPVVVDARDRFVLPGDVEGPILSLEGVVNPATLAVYAVEVFLGTST